MATLNIGMKVNRAITGATTVNANAYAMVTYNATATGSATGSNTVTASMPPITRYFGPGQSIPASFTTLIGVLFSSSAINSTGTITYTLQSGVELINTI